MLFCPVFAKLHSRRSLVLLHTDHCSRTTSHYSSKSHGINPFADPHPLNPVASIFYKNIGGRGVPPTFSARSARKPVAHLLFFSITCAMSLAQFLSSDNLPFSWGYGVHSFLTFHHPLPTTRTIRCLFILLRTLLHSPKTQPFYFQAIPHSLPKTPGGGGRHLVS